jgi:putative membrane protein
MRKVLALMIAVGCAATTASAQTSSSASTGTKSPSTSPNDVIYPVTRNAAVAAPAIPPGQTTLRPATVDGREPVGAMNDGLFVAAAAAGGMAEIGVSRIALERAGSDETKLFAQKMVNDHTRANRELTQLAASKQIVVPTALDIKDRATAAALSGISGEEFDRCYAKQQHAAHICTVELFEAEAKRGQDPELKAWAAKMLPTLKQHKMTAKEICERHEKMEKPSAR